MSGAAPFPRVELLAELPVLGTDDLLAVPVGEGGALPAWLTGPAPVVSAELLTGALADTGNRGAAGTITNVPIAGRRPRSVVAVGTGAGTLPELRRYVGRLRAARADAGRARRDAPGAAAGRVPAGADEVRAAVETALLAGYRFRDSSAQSPRRLAEVAVVAATPRSRAAAAAAGEVTARAVAWARDLVNTPPNVADPEWLAGQVRTRLGALPHVSVTVLGPDELRAGGFGGVLAVGGGSASPPLLVVVTYRPPSAGPAHPVLVGKGITFDTGGISIKTNAGLRHMHTDMAGAAAVLAAVEAAARLGLPVAVTAVVPAAENAVSGAAYRPADVVRHVGGRTTEVRNTDAEGRLVLADALAYARLELGATVLVDVATLTGAMKQALGARTAGLYATSDGLADALAPRPPPPGSRCGGCRWTSSTATCWTAASPTPTTRRATPAARRRRCSCGPSPATCPGRTWTSPGRRARARTTARRSRAAPASAPARCCGGWRPVRRERLDRWERTDERGRAGRRVPGGPGRPAEHRGTGPGGDRRRAAAGRRRRSAGRRAGDQLARRVPDPLPPPGRGRAALRGGRPRHRRARGSARCTGGCGSPTPAGETVSTSLSGPRPPPPLHTVEVSGTAEPERELSLPFHGRAAAGRRAAAAAGRLGRPPGSSSPRAPRRCAPWWRTRSGCGCPTAPSSSSAPAPRWAR